MSRLFFNAKERANECDASKSYVLSFLGVSDASACLDAIPDKNAPQT